jgi:hypothetical protein
MKVILFLASVAGLLGSMGCESDHHHHRDRAHWEHREHEDHPVYRVQPGYAPPPGAVYREYPNYGYRP